MSLIKKIIFSLFLISSIAFAFWAYFNLKNSKKPQLDALSVLPDNCLVYFNTNNFFELNKKINSQSLIADKLKLFDDINTFCNTLNLFDSVFTSNLVLEEMLNKTPIHFGLYEKDLGWLTTFNIKRLGNQELIIKELTAVLKVKETENNIYSFTLNNSQQFYFTLNAGVVIISNAKENINLALNKSIPKIQNNQHFIKFKNTLEENALLSIYINHQLYLKNKTTSKLNLSLLCKNGFSAGNISLEPSQLTLNGFLLPDTTDILSSLYEQEPQTPDFFNLLPNSTTSLKAYGFSSFEKLKNQVNKFAPNINSAFWKQVTDTALFNVEKDFFSNTENYLVNFETKLPNGKFILQKVIDTEKAKEHLGFMSDSTFYSDSLFIYKLKNKNLKTKLKLFNSFFNLQTSYVIIHNSNLIFAETNNELLQLINELKTGASITKNESFSNYKNQNLSESFNYMVYNSPNKNKEDIKTFFNFETNEKINPFENFKHFSLLISNNRTNFKYRCQLTNETETVNKERNVLWTLNLDYPSSNSASIFKNHITKENEIVLQDENKNLYLINAKGTVLWKKHLTEKISSKIFIVDIFKNNKYQLLFNTENYLHLIDRNGNYVQGYPVKLPDASTSELSLIDYDNDKDYRLFIACKNNTIYNYSIYGIKQEKFTPVKTESQVNLPIQYVKVGLSDYLVAVDKEGKIYTFSRKGEGRIGLRNRTIESCKAFYVDATNNINSTYLIYIDDKDNLINKISFSDKKTIEKLNADIDSSAIKFAQVDSKKTMDIIITKANSILAYNLNGNQIFEKTIGDNLSETTYYSDDSRSLFLTFSDAKNELILFDRLKQKTKIIKATALPLIYDLFNNNKKYLIVTDGNQLSCVAF
ncbi:MAG: hypothetical protein Q7W45_07680 [Bacteroidota bacterium]|nr:hypothetical protein [Bacteroidota bacterium]MDP3144021.1 hypothetical protein [Bacteroidota bacterium]